MSHTYIKLLLCFACCSLSLVGHPKEVEEWTRLVMSTDHGKEEFKRDPSFLKSMPLSDYTKAELKNQLKKAIVANNKQLQSTINNLNLEQMLLVYHITNKHVAVKETPALHTLFNSLPSTLQKELAQK